MKTCIALASAAVVALSLISLQPEETVAAGGAVKGDAKDGYKLVADLFVVMEFADDVFYKIPDKVKAGKVRRVRNDAMIIAELMNVSKHSEDYGKEDGWSDALTKTIDQLVELSKAAKAKDAEKVTALHKKVEASCDSCHEKFRD